jgi:DNA-binding response OmpR family regulator
MTRARRVLVVEDEYLIAMELKDALESAGIDVLGPVPSVADAMRLLDGPVDGAVLDINLGGESVYPLCEALRSRNVHFVFATGYSAEDVPEAWRQVARFEKPVNTAQVLRAFS